MPGAWRDSRREFGRVSRWLHWGMALLLAGLFAVGWYMTELTYYDPLYQVLPTWHEQVGLVALAALLLRWGWKLSSATPEPEPGPYWEHLAARIMHQALYLLMLLLPVSGYLISTADGRPVEFFGMFDVPAVLPSEKGREELAGAIHAWLAYGGGGLVLLHAAAALKHHLIDRDRTLLRMLGRSR